MELTDVIERRASVREFAPDSVNPDDLWEMARLAHLAPSVNNSQPWRFIAITNKDLLRRMAEAVQAKLAVMLPDTDDERRRLAKEQVCWFSTHFGKAPAVFAILKHPYKAVVDVVLPEAGLSHEEMNAMRGRPDIESMGAAIEHLILAAVNLGYGACWLSGPLVARQELQDLLDVQEPWELEAMVAVGHPVSHHAQREKKPIEEVFELRA